jgi:hypothetical protein
MAAIAYKRRNIVLFRILILMGMACTSVPYYFFLSHKHDDYDFPAPTTLKTSL